MGTSSSACWCGHPARDRPIPSAGELSKDRTALRLTPDISFADRIAIAGIAETDHLRGADELLSRWQARRAPRAPTRASCPPPSTDHQPGEVAALAQTRSAIGKAPIP
jgi:hypothetical protein